MITCHAVSNAPVTPLLTALPPPLVTPLVTRHVTPLVTRYLARTLDAPGAGPSLPCPALKAVVLFVGGSFFVTEFANPRGPYRAKNLGFGANAH